MKEYENYQDFIDELILWGDGAVCAAEKEQTDKAASEIQDTQEGFKQILYRSQRAAEREVFSPFLYIALSAGLDKQEARLLAAVLYYELSDQSIQRFDFSFWMRFWRKDENFSGAGLFYEASPLLYDREESGGELCLRLEPHISLFLKREVLLEEKIPGMYWYHKRGGKLSYLGESVRKCEQMEACIKEISGKKLFYLHGRRGSGRKLNYAYLADRMGRSLAVASFKELDSWQHLRRILVECVLQHGMLAVEFKGEEPPDMAELSILSEWMAGEENLFVTGEWEELPEAVSEDRQYLSFGIDEREVLNDRELFFKLTQEYEWEREEDREYFLGRYAFLPGKMRSILELARTYAVSEGKKAISEGRLKRAVLHSGASSLKKYAKKITCSSRMEDLILPAAQKEKLFHIINRVKNKKRIYEEWGFYQKSAYGNGVSMIFAGSPGTGKTMAAGVMAAELSMELYRVELPAVVDKYIGEMEKKLNRIFEEAEKSTAILFFDEADVLFSKRTEVKESNDKYSNMEIAFLLQKMEEYEGVSILATNYLKNFDEAFRRRITDIVDFPVPDAYSRETMWKTMLPGKLPVSGDIDYAFLAGQFQITGSVIKNSLLYGSFLAAESPEKELTMKMVLEGIAHELEKSGRKLNREDYGEYHDFREW